MLDGLRKRLERRLEKLLGDLPEQRQAFDRSADQQSEVDAFRGLGNDAIAAGNLGAAEELFRKGLQIRPDDGKCLVCLGYVLKEQGRLSEARIALRRAIDGSKDTADRHETYYLLGQIGEQQGDYDDALKNYVETLRLQPDFGRACKDICRIYTQQGNIAAARATLEACVAVRPDNVDYRLWLTDLCVSAIDYPGVVEHLGAAVRLGAKSVRNYMTLGAALCRLGRVTEGAEALAIGEAMDPTQAHTTQYELGYYYLTAGDVNRGLQHMERCIELEPDFLLPHNSVVMTLSYASRREDGQYQQAALRFADALRRQVSKPPTIANHEVPATQSATVLRLGFVSGDLHRHPVAYFLLDVLKHLDRSAVRLVAYANSPVSDEITDALKLLFDEWQPIRHLTDEAAASLIRSQNIDILVDLGGHTGENRLGIFGWRPAPTQVSWLGYWASTGLKEIDYVLADRHSVPEDSTEWFAEAVYRLPHTRLCMAIPRPSRPIVVTEPPCRAKGYVTFGSFQQVAKITPQVIEVWGKVLAAVPGSRLRLQTKNLGKQAIRQELTEALTHGGIDLTRVELLADVDLDAYLEAHGEVDILLDTFPYPGGTTTSFALWMGVPTITMAGDTMLSRQGAAMLQCVGLSDWVASTEAAFIEIARSRSADIEGLTALRRGLRQAAEVSPLFDANRFAADFLHALFEMSSRARS